jgi:hypothetical protein
MKDTEGKMFPMAFLQLSQRASASCHPLVTGRVLSSYAKDSALETGVNE